MDVCIDLQHVAEQMRVLVCGLTGQAVAPSGSVVDIGLGDPYQQEEAMLQLLHLVLHRLAHEHEHVAHAWYRQVAQATPADVMANMSFTCNPLHLVPLMALLLNSPVRVVVMRHNDGTSTSCVTPRGKHITRQLVDIVPPCGEHWLATMPTELAQVSIGKSTPFILPPKPIIIHQLHHGRCVTQAEPQLLTPELAEVAGRWRLDVLSYAQCEVVRRLRRRVVYHARATPGACDDCREGLVHGQCIGAFCGYGLCRTCQGTQWKHVSATLGAAAVCTMVGWLCKTCLSRGRDINNNAYLKAPEVNVAAGSRVKRKSKVPAKAL